MKLTIASKFSLLTGLLVTLTAGVVAFVFYIGTSRSLVEHSLEELSHKIKSEGLRLQDEIEGLRSDVRFFAGTLPVQGVIRSYRNANANKPGKKYIIGRLSHQQWRSLLANVFSLAMNTHSSINQMRIIAANGDELVRVNRTNSGMYIVPNEELQNKAGRSYFKGTMRLQANEVYLSEINLEKEYGQIVVPHLPVLRAATQVFDDSGKLFGFIIINHNFGLSLQRIKQQMPVKQGMNLYVTDHYGSYLLHPDSSKTFGFDLGKRYRVQEDFPLLAEFYMPESKKQTVTLLPDQTHSNLTTVYSKIPFGAANSGRYISVGLTQSYAAIIGDQAGLLTKSAYWSMLLILIGIVLSIGFSHLLVRPLKQITEGIENFTLDKGDSLLPVGRQDELGILARSFTNLISRVRTQTTDLQVAVDEANAASQAKSEFLANMSHEIRTPLNGVLGMLHLLYKTKLQSKQKQYVDTATGSSEMLLTVINDILDFSKMEAGKMELEHIPYYPVSLVEDSVSLVAKSAFDKKLELICEVEPNVPAVILGDPIRLRQVLTNLIGNAIKFTSEGEILLYVARQGEKIHFSVIDSGIGMDEVQQKAIFQAFGQADTSTTRKFGGTGLGLTISSRLVTAMGGELVVTSSPGDGAEFSFNLPLEVLGDELSIHHESEMLPKQRILLVDDSLFSLKVIKKTLKHWGVVHIGEAGSGADALDQLYAAVKDGQPYDLALIDMVMPGIDGIELAQIIRDETSLRKMGVIMLSPPDFHSSTIKTVDAWLSKPIRQNDLHDSLKLLIGEVDDVDLFFDLEGQDKKDRWWFGGHKLLLVEDNETNQQVASEILLDVGFEVDIRENGKLALQAVQEKSYDVVLMDIQMPVMDGIEACKKIRALGHHFQTLPIIAMTAHALSGDSAKSLEAGMNDHVTKPINPEELFQSISQWIEAGEKPEDQINNIAETASEDLPELPGIELEEGLARMRGNWLSYKKILKGFRQKQCDSADALSSYLQNSELEEAGHIAHTLKGSGGNIGAQALSQIAAKVEQACKDGNKDQALSLFDDLALQLEKVINGLAVLEEEPVSSTAAETTIQAEDNETLISLLGQMEGYLETDLSEAQNCLLTLEGYVTGTKLKSNFVELEDAMNSFDMDAAKENIQRLKQDLVA